jgi:hypothetical protein
MTYRSLFEQTKRRNQARTAPVAPQAAGALSIRTHRLLSCRWRLAIHYVKAVARAEDDRTIRDVAAGFAQKDFIEMPRSRDRKGIAAWREGIEKTV